MKIISLDIGDKNIGIAITDRDKHLSIPHSVIRNDNTFNEEFDRILDDNEIDKIIVGMPYTLKGEIGKQGEKILDFVKDNILDRGIEITYIDERFTSNIPMKASLNKKKMKDQVDKFSAALILQSYLERTTNMKKGANDK